MNFSKLSDNGTIINYKDLISYDANKPGVVYGQEEVTEYGIFGQAQKKNKTRTYTILYSDNNLFLVFGCLETYNFWWSEINYSYYVYVRNRTFDSINQLIPAIKAIKQIKGDLNQLQLITNDKTCPN